MSAFLMISKPNFHLCCIQIFTFGSSTWPLKSFLNLVTWFLNVITYRKVQKKPSLSGSEQRYAEPKDSVV